MHPRFPSTSLTEHRLPQTVTHAMQPLPELTSAEPRASRLPPSQPATPPQPTLSRATADLTATNKNGHSSGGRARRAHACPSKRMPEHTHARAHSCPLVAMYPNAWPLAVAAACSVGASAPFRATLRPSHAQGHGRSHDAPVATTRCHRLRWHQRPIDHAPACMAPSQLTAVSVPARLACRMNAALREVRAPGMSADCCRLGSALACRFTSPQQRPAALRMHEQIKKLSRKGEANENDQAHFAAGLSICRNTCHGGNTEEV